MQRLAGMASRKSKHNPVRTPSCLNKQRSCFIPLPALHNQTWHNIYVYVCVFLQHLINVKHIFMKHYMRPLTVSTVRGSNPGGGEIFRTRPDWPWGPTSLLYNGYQVLPGGKQRTGRDADPHPLLVPRSRKGKAITLFPHVPYGLYRASVPVQGCTLPLALHANLPVGFIP